MNSLAHDTIFSSYSSRAKSPAPATGRVVHSTLFSSYDVADRVANLPPRAIASDGLMARFNAWCTARKRAREDRAMWALARGDVRVMNELNSLRACAE